MTPRQNNPSIINDDLRDAELSRLYQASAEAEPPAALDALILKAATEAVQPATTPPKQIAPKQAAHRWQRWFLPLSAGGLATAFVLVLLVNIVLRHDEAPTPNASAPIAMDTTTALPLSADTRPSPATISAAKQSKEAKTRSPVSERPLAAAPASIATADQAASKKQVESENAQAKLSRAESAPLPIPERSVAGAPTPIVAADQEAGKQPASRADARAKLSGTDSAPLLAETAEAPAKTTAEHNRTPEDWLNDIRQLRRAGRTSAADRQLAAFKRRYPAFVLPQDLRQTPP